MLGVHLLMASLLRQKPKEKTKNAVKKLKLTVAKKPKLGLQPKEDPITSESGGSPAWRPLALAPELLQLGTTVSGPELAGIRPLCCKCLARRAWELNSSCL